MLHGKESGVREMNCMHATEKNLKICELIIKTLHENEVSVFQACAILDFTKNKIAQDTKVGKLIHFEDEDVSKNLRPSLRHLHQNS